MHFSLELLSELSGDISICIYSCIYCIYLYLNATGTRDWLFMPAAFVPMRSDAFGQLSLFFFVTTNDQPQPATPMEVQPKRIIIIWESTPTNIQ